MRSFFKLFLKLSQMLFSIAISIMIGVGPLPTVKAEDDNEGLRTTHAVLDMLGGSFTKQAQTNQATMQQNAQRQQLAQMKTRFYPNQEYFNCSMLPTQQSHQSEFVCKTGSMHPTIMQEYISIAQHNYRMYEKAITPKSLPGTNSEGTECIQKRMENELMKFTKNKNELTKMINGLQKYHETFKDITQKSLNDMRDALSYLNGSSKKDNNKAMSKSWHATLRGSCRGIVSDSQAKRTNGLRSLKKVADKKIESANQLLSRDIAQDIKDMFTNMASDKKKYGVNGIESNASYKAAQAIIAKETKELKKDYELIKNKLGKWPVRGINRSLRPMDSKIQDNLAAVIKRVDRFKNTNIENCMFNRGDHRGGLDPDSIIKNLTLMGLSKRDQKRGTAKRMIQLQLDRILKNSDPLTSKIKKLKLFEKSSPTPFRIKLNTPYANLDADTNYSPSYLYKKIETTCNNWYDEGSSYMDENRTQKAIDEELVKEITDFRDKERNFVSNLQSTVVDKVMNCSGKERYTPKISNCSNDSLDPASNADFCAKNAIKCASKIKSCDNKLASKITEIEAAHNVMVKEHNQRMAKYKQRQNDELQRIYKTFEIQAEQIKNVFKAEYEVPENLFITKTPPNDVTSLEARLIGVDANGNPENMIKNLVANVSKIKNAMNQQAENFKNKISGYINQQKNLYQSEHEYWKGVATTCSGAYFAAREAAQKQIMEQREKEAKATQSRQDALIQRCNQERALATQPGCRERVTELVVAWRLTCGKTTDKDGNVTEECDKATKFCKTQLGDGDDNEDKDTELTVTELCDFTSNDTEDLIDHLTENMFSNVSSKLANSMRLKAHNKRVFKLMEDIGNYPSDDESNNKCVYDKNEDDEEKDDNEKKSKKIKIRYDDDNDNCKKSKLCEALQIASIIDEMGDVPAKNKNKYFKKLNKTIKDKDVVINDEKDIEKYTKAKNKYDKKYASLAKHYRKLKNDPKTYRGSSNLGQILSEECKALYGGSKTNNKALEKEGANLMACILNPQAAGCPGQIGN